MTSLDRLRLLQTRIREAKGADWKLDQAICSVFFPAKRFRLGEVPPYTTDPDGLGACVALIEAMLPQANCIGFDRTPKSVIGYVSRNCVASGHWLKEAERADRNICLALLEAAITAKISEEESSTLTAASIAAEKE